MSKHIDSSPTLHVPLTFNLVPGSVLDPTWKQPTDPVSVESPPDTSTSSSSSSKAIVESPSSNVNENSSISKDVMDKSNKLDCDVSVTSESSERNSESGNTLYNASLTCSEDPSKTVNTEKPVLYLCEWECCTATFELKHQVGLITFY
ncbi:unnamed protein product [Schistosoma mattheei]|uniref:Uncharacterized protein n=1 Tax=Schistosoma mattheei TaxID=31246 RepID=A0A183NPU2_9TREM|nr:unnamed protein product [Schistosoma mattheei]